MNTHLKAAADALRPSHIATPFPAALHGHAKRRHRRIEEPREQTRVQGARVPSAGRERGCEGRDEGRFCAKNELVRSQDGDVRDGTRKAENMEATT
jgi:hypothetical protein